MRGRDEETGEFFGPSRSQRRREALAVFDLAQALVELSPSRLDRVPLDEALRDLVVDSRRITAHIARKRQLQFLAKQLRQEDEETLEAIRRALEPDRAEARRETARLHRLEDWRERLLADEGSALGELIALHPEIDRQRLRQLLRAVHEERRRDKPPKAYRELFQLLRQTFTDADASSADGDAAADPDEHG